jgi:diguanylate cyclase (GGDEF)-like protein
MPRLRSETLDWTPWISAVALVAVAALLNAGPLSFLSPSQHWITYWFAATIAAVSGGLTAGLLATLLSCAAKLLCVHFATGASLFSRNTGWLEVAMFAANGTLISCLTNALNLARRRADLPGTLIGSMDEGFCVIEMIHDAEGKPVDYRFLYSNPMFLKHTGLDLSTGKTMREMVPSHDVHWFEIYDTVARTGAPIRFENEAVAMGRDFDVFAFRIGESGSNRVGILFNDISERKRMEMDLRRNAHSDAGTGLPDRKTFFKHLAKSVAQADRAKQSLALLFVDLEGLELPHAGTVLPQSAAHRLSGCVRAVDHLCSMGESAFSVIAENCKPQDARQIADKIVREFQTPLDLDGSEIRLNIGIGVVTYPDCSSDADTLVHMAEAAMYAAKREGGNGYHFLR